MVKKYYSLLLFLLLAYGLQRNAATLIWNQSLGYNINVDFSTWSNSGNNGGCVTCPYTCVKPSIGPDGTSLNFTNSTQMNSVPGIYSATQMNGCCYAPKSASTIMPDCNNEANPTTAEACGFLSGPSLAYSITVNKSATDLPYKIPLIAILFASVDCQSFWAIGYTLVKQAANANKVTGSKIINQGCYGNPKGSPILLVGCLTTELQFVKSNTYTWQQLALKCRGLGGRCSRTNSLWGSNLQCCIDKTSLNTPWDMVNYPLYSSLSKSSAPLDGLAISAIVLASVGAMMFIVHFAAKARERARQVELRREQESAEDYEEIITPLTAQEKKMGVGAAGNRSTIPIPPKSVIVSLEEGDQIYRPPKDELLYEGSLY